MRNFNELINTINQIHKHLQQSAANAVNQMLTVRNWLIGYYIVEFEQNGEDRAKYGTSLLKSIADKLRNIKGIDERSLRRYRKFYLYYPQLIDAIRGSLIPELSDTVKTRLLIPLLHKTEKVSMFVKYATAGMDENIFVQKYMLKLPSTEVLQKYIEREIRKV